MERFEVGRFLAAEEGRPPDDHPRCRTRRPDDHPEEDAGPDPLDDMGRFVAESGRFVEESSGHQVDERLDDDGLHAEGGAGSPRDRLVAPRPNWMVERIFRL